MKRKIDKFKFYDLVIYAARGSHSARRLASALGSRRWRDDLPERYSRRRPYFRGNRSPLVINWGSTRPAEWLQDPRFRLTPVWVNAAHACQKAIDKQDFFRTFDGRESDIPILRNTADRAVAEEWLKKGHGVVARKTTTGSGGAGIVVVQKGGVLPQAPLYTRYYPKTHEFRAHVWDDKVIDFTQKKLKGGWDDGANRAIRNHANGWIHAHDGIELKAEGRQAIEEASVRCIALLGLRFGAVDILARLSPGDRSLINFRICEVNTGPGLENTETIEAYSKAILNTYREVKRS